MILTLLLLFLSSCSYEPWVDVELVIPEQHPFEDAFSESMWFTLSYFNGERIVDEHIPKGSRNVSVKVRSGGLAVFSFRPIGELGAIGGFYEPGDERRVNVLPEYGAFAEMLLNAASYRAEPVSRLSVREVLSAVDDIQAIDETEFLRDIFNGTLGYGIKLNDKYLVRYDSIPEGVWISERFDIPSFEIDFTGESVSLMLYPGVYRYAEVSRRLLLTVIIDEEGEGSFMMSGIPLW